MAQTSSDFVPVLLGTEIGAYGLARAFWERYGVTSVAYGIFPLTPTAHSKFIEVRTFEDFMDPAGFVARLNADASDFRGKKVLVIPCGDDYSLLLSEHKGELDPVYVPVCSSPEVLESLNNKASFYRFCERAGVPYPQTVTVSSPEVPSLPFGYPVAVKPTDAASYRAHPFEGQKKAFIIHDEATLAETLHRVYASGYDAELVVQDFIPGDDGNMRVMNGYMRSDGTLAMLSLGHPVLEDCAPMRIGNYAAIYSYGDEEIYQMVEGLMAHIDYFGYFNIDMKYDSRDDTYKIFDFNPRQGRSSFFTTLSGCNLAQYVVEDLVEGRHGTCVHGQEEVLWLGVPKSIVRRYAKEGPAKDRALELMRQGKSGTTLFGAHDDNPRRLWEMSKLWVHYYLDFRRWFGHTELE